MAKYRYNGVALPGMPSEVENGLYPRLSIVQNKSTELYNLICTKSNVYAVEDYGTVGVNGIMLYPEPNSGRGFSCSASSFAWSVYADLDAALSPSETTILTFTDDKYRFVWTNTDIADSTGTVHYEASEPVPMFDLKAWLTGLALGLAGKPLPLSMEKREPIAYLYNGVQLPPLPDGVYSHNMLVHSSSYGRGINILLSFINKPVHPESAGYPMDPDIVYWAYDKTDYLWEKANISIPSSDLTYIWADFDYCDSSGNVLCAVSEPVPVYE